MSIRFGAPGNDVNQAPSDEPGLHLVLHDPLEGLNEQGEPILEFSGVRCRSDEGALAEIQTVLPIDVTMPCGRSRKWETLADIPLTDEACTCEQLNHWFWRWT